MTRLPGPVASFLDPGKDASGAVVAARTAVLLAPAILVANVMGAAVVYACAEWIVPSPDLAEPDEVSLVNLIALGGYLLVALPVGVVAGVRGFRIRTLLRDDAALGYEQLMRIVRGPLRLMALNAVLWGTAVVVFSGLNLVYSPLLALKVALTVLLGGLTTCAIVYLLSERLLRPAFRWALARSTPRRQALPGVAARGMLAWAVGSGVPALGLVFVAIAALAGGDISETQLVVTILGLGAVALLIGAGVTYLAAKTTADPVVGVRDALAAVEEGELDVEVDVYDGSEVGLLQAGFNRMVAGIRERERLRDLFGRHVGEDVARAAMEQGVQLGGEERDVAVLFVDLVGSTRLASERPPAEVVALLNRFFGLVVDVIARHGGFVNKFEGDAVLAVFGAPVAREDACAQALAAGRELIRRLREEGLEFDAGVGISSGRAVAGNIGDERRFEYTVIGDPVNEAARLSERAKSADGRLLASEAAVSSAGAREAERWRLGKAVTLRGRSDETRLASPVEAGAA